MKDGLKNAHDLRTGSKPAPGDLAFIQGFVNSTDLESGEDRFATVEGARNWLEHHGLVGSGAELAEWDRERLVDYRNALRMLLLSNNGAPLPSEAIEGVRRATEGVLLRLEMSERGTLSLLPAGEGADKALGMLQSVVHEAMLDGSWTRLKACLSDSCQWAFYDASKNRSGTWCSMKVCGNRMKVRSHRERNQPASGY